MPENIGSSTSSNSVAHKTQSPSTFVLSTSDAVVVHDVIATSESSNTHENRNKQNNNISVSRTNNIQHLLHHHSPDDLICMGSLFRKISGVFYFPFKRLAKHSAVKLLVLFAGVYLLITFFGLPDYIYINQQPKLIKSEPKISNFDKHRLQEDNNQQKQNSKIEINHEKDLALYDVSRFEEAKKSVIAQTCNNYSKNANSNPDKQRLFFLKTHKTGSSTLQAIFFRKALKDGKLVMLPREDGKHTFAYPTPFAGYLSDDKCYTQKKCHFLSSHTVFGPKALTAFPKDETHYRKGEKNLNL